MLLPSKTPLYLIEERILNEILDFFGNTDDVGKKTADKMIANIKNHSHLYKELKPDSDGEKKEDSKKEDSKKEGDGKKEDKNITPITEAKKQNVVNR